ncbi:hypothetical protein DSECCO2_304190 [anaerobic digester metagenome]
MKTGMVSGGAIDGRNGRGGRHCARNPRCSMVWRSGGMRLARPAAKFAVKTLVQTVLPWLARLNQRQIQRLPSRAFEQRLRHELRSVVRTQAQRGSTFADQSGQHLDHPARLDAPDNVYSQAFTRVFVYHGQAFDLLTVSAGVADKVVRPQFVCSHRQLRSWVGRRHAFPRPLPGHLQPGFGPQPERLVGAHDMPQTFHEHVDPAISKARIRRS